MVAQWMRVGFVHGVMNTDNMSILGLTIDYGPYGWLEDYDPEWTPNTTDAAGRRYRFGAQPQVAYWNLGRLAQALAPLFEDVSALQDGLDRYVQHYRHRERAHIAAKLGLAECRDADVQLMEDLRSLMHQAEIDMTLWFRGLLDIDAEAPVLLPLLAAFMTMPSATRTAWRCRPGCSATPRACAKIRSSPRSAASKCAWPTRATCRATTWRRKPSTGSSRATPTHWLDWLEVLRHPYDDQPGREAYAQRRPDWAKQRAGCSMLSCSS